MTNGRHVRILAGRLDNSSGSSKYHRELALRLAARGHRVSVVAFETQPEVAACCDLTTLPRRPFEQTPLLWRFAAVRQWRWCAAQLRKANLSRPDVVICGEHLFLDAHRRRFPDVPWIYLPHSMVVDQEIASYGMQGLAHHSTLWVYRRLQRIGLSRAARTLRFTHIGCRVLAEHYAKLRPQFVVNPVGIEIPRENFLTDIETPCRLLIVGRLTAAKRLSFALGCLERLKSPAWQLEIVGGGEQRAELEAAVDRAGQRDQVRFHGHQADPSEWYRRADLLLFPSRSESLGLVALEAMAHGVPVLGMLADGRTVWNANSEFIDDRVTGLLASDEDGFTQRLQWALSHRDDLRRMGAAAREYVERRHTWDAHLCQYESLFEELRSATTP